MSCVRCTQSQLMRALDAESDFANDDRNPATHIWHLRRFADLQRAFDAVAGQALS